MLNLHDRLRMLHLRPGGRRSDGPVSPASPWSEARGRPRVVVENEDAAFQWAAAGLLESAGYEVACCGGPRDLPNRQCPLVADDQCPLIDGADLVVNGLGIGDASKRAVLTALRTRRSRVPVIVEIPTPRLGELHAGIPGCRTVPYPVRPKVLIAAVDDAVLGSLDDDIVPGM